MMGQRIERPIVRIKGVIVEGVIDASIIRHVMGEYVETATVLIDAKFARPETSIGTIEHDGRWFYSGAIGFTWQ